MLFLLTTNSIRRALQDLCECGEVQTMSSTIDLFPTTKLEAGPCSLQAADQLALDRETSYGRHAGWPCGWGSFAELVMVWNQAV